MAKYKVLKSIAHNLGHSYLSLVNYQADDYIIEHLFRTAREANEPHVKIDVLRGTIEPSAFQTPVLLESVAQQRVFLGHLVQRQGAVLDMVTSARISIDFDFARTRLSRSVPGLELAMYNCIVEIVNDRGKSHIASVPEWWRY